MWAQFRSNPLTRIAPPAVRPRAGGPECGDQIPRAREGRRHLSTTHMICNICIYLKSLANHDLRGRQPDRTETFKMYKVGTGLDRRYEAGVAPDFGAAEGACAPIVHLCSMWRGCTSRAPDLPAIPEVSGLLRLRAGSASKQQILSLWICLCMASGRCVHKGQGAL